MPQYIFLMFNALEYSASCGFSFISCLHLRALFCIVESSLTDAVGAHEPEITSISGTSSFSACELPSSTAAAVVKVRCYNKIYHNLHMPYQFDPGIDLNGTSLIFNYRVCLERS